MARRRKQCAGVFPENIELHYACESEYSASLVLPRVPQQQTSRSHAQTLCQVDELIQGLEDLSCLRTTGEDQTICVMSDSFNNLGLAADLQASGDLPAVDVVKVQ